MKISTMQKMKTLIMSLALIMGTVSQLSAQNETKKYLTTPIKASQLTHSEIQQLHQQVKPTTHSMSISSYKSDNLALDSTVHLTAANTGILQEQDKTEYTYSTGNNTIVAVSHQWDTQQGTWEKLHKKSTRYNNDLQVENYTTYNWNVSQAEWIPAVKLINNYNSNGTRISEQYSAWDPFTEAWKVTSRIDMVLNTDGTIQQQTSSNYDTDSDSWYPVNRISYVYGNDQITEVTGEIYDHLLGAWQPNFRFAHYYNGAGKLNFSEFHFYYNQTWVHQQISNYYYDAAGNPVAELISSLNENTGIFDPIQKTELTYDLTQAINTIQCPVAMYWGISNQHNIFNKPQSYALYNYHDNEWELSDEFSHYYSDIIKPVTEAESIVQLVAYPNPTPSAFRLKGKAQFDYAVVKIFSIQGKEEFSANIRANDEISIDHLSNGIYIYQITDGLHSYTGRITKR